MHPERRQHVRILTIKNFGWSLLALLLVITVANIVSELRPARSGEYGRLTIKSEPVEVKHPQVVTESEVPDMTPISPPVSLLTGPPEPPPAPPSQPPTVSAAMVATQTHPGQHVTIVGGPDGVHVEANHRDATPKLSGGIFRQ